MSKLNFWDVEGERANDVPSPWGIFHPSSFGAPTGAPVESEGSSGAVQSNVYGATGTETPQSDSNVNQLLFNPNALDFQTQLIAPPINSASAGSPLDDITIEDTTAFPADILNPQFYDGNISSGSISDGGDASSSEGDAGDD
ncbi:MAG TPA: hypothetical protein VL996_08395 [Methylocella sp.]|nr:hypothetical protein [Methylocella sp.]